MNNTDINTFTALLLTQSNDRSTQATVTKLPFSELPSQDVIVDVEYSSLNYKDALAITGSGKIVRSFPMIAGIDFAGTVSHSSDERYQTGDAVVLTGWGVGETHWGGMATKAAVNADWLIPLPTGLTTKRAMVIGTAGLTAMLCVQALLDAGITPDAGDVLVAGASGGVGSVAVQVLSQLGFSVTAVTGRASEHGDWLRSLGATQILERQQFAEPTKPLEKAQWAAAVDAVGGQILAKILSQMQYGGVVAMCGLAGGADLPTTVMPFILRGVSLLGIDSVQCPYDRRLQAWQKLAELLPEAFYKEAGDVIGLDEVSDYATKLLSGGVKGRTLIKL